MRSARKPVQRAEQPEPYWKFCERPQPKIQPPMTPDYTISINWTAVLNAGLIVGSLAGIAWMFADNIEQFLSVASSVSQ